MDIILLIIAVAFFFFLFRGAEVYDTANEEEAKRLNVLAKGRFRVTGPELDKLRKFFIYEGGCWDEKTDLEKADYLAANYAGSW
ncbi:MAG: hypothetical protein ACK5N8_05865 [Alphaproteobacteria bacterium]